MPTPTMGANKNDGGLLSGLRVIDCGTYVAGPAAATIMSDFGAEVIKIERPGGGDLWRLFSKLPGTAKSELDWCWVLTSRNKKSVALDLGRPEGREALIRLVAHGGCLPDQLPENAAREIPSHLGRPLAR